ncbi:MAG: acetoin utilization protein AcuC [Aquificaceae bacterium]|nr:acetoin utilization protein AcuC [Aquificaceae bacterium]MDW8032875.1 acetoin utilization protein AcuC [Aquificaceae bacterium]MDW8294710.1 acetoin utilization protein AcuC [Aquificaceae bacterium]
MPKGARLIGSFRYRNLRYTKNHPLRVPRVSLLLELLLALGLLEEEELVESRPALWEELTLFHEEEYLRALEECDRCQCVKKDYRERFNIGTYENPVSPAMWRGSLLATGSSIQAVELYLKGYIAFNPAGGMHHAYPSRAKGFCFINDPGVTLQTLLKEGFRRVLYIDLDAHHCDGVQDFFYEEDRVFVLSLHQSPEYAFPFSRGYLKERGAGKGKGYNLNLPLPPGLKDGEFLYVLEKSLTLIKDIYKPEVYVLQLGTDALKEDYLSKFELSNRGFLEAFDLVRDLLGEGVYLGGGGYHPVALARAWVLLWCRLSQKPIPEFLTPKAREVLLSVDFEEFEEDVDRGYMYEKLLDPPAVGEVRREVKRLVEEAIGYYLF